MSAALDPALHITLRAALSLLFLWAAVHKLRDIAAFTQAFNGYQLLPERLVPAASMCLIAVELALACSLPWLSAGAPALIAACLLAMYAAAIAINLARGRRHIDCGCAGPAERQPLSGALIVRNAVLCVAALVAAVPSSPRPLEWMDLATIAGGIAAFCFLYASVDGLLANASRLASLRSPVAEQSLPVALGEV